MAASTFSSFLFSFLAYMGGLAVLLWDSVVYIARGAVSYRHTIRQMAEVGVGSLLVALVTVGFSGAVFSLYVSIQLMKFSQPGYVGGLVGKSLALEVAPVITAIVVAARAGSAMTAELGSMVVTQQVDALRAMATSPTRYLVVPRLVATILMLPLVTALANAAGLVGGYVSAVSNGVTSVLFWRSFQEITTIHDQFNGLVKTIPFAIIISLVCCYQGLNARGGARGVGRATTNAVVISMVGVYITDYFLSIVLQGIR